MRQALEDEVQMVQGAPDRASHALATGVCMTDGRRKLSHTEEMRAVHAGGWTPT